MTSDLVLTACILLIFVFIGFLIVFVLMGIGTIFHGYLLVPEAHALIANTTANLPVPIQVKVNSGEPAAANHALPTDAGTLAALVGIGGAVFHRWRQGDKREKVGAETDAKIVGSLKNTDHGIAESLTTISSAISAIPGVPDEVKNMVKSEADSWHEDNKAYYQNTPPPAANKITSDPVIQQQAATQDATVRSDD